MKENTLRRIAIVLAALTVLATAATVRAADDRPAPALQRDRFFTEVGFITGFGYSTVTEGDYLPVPLIVHLGTDMKRWFPSLRDHRGTLSLFFEPQFNLVFGHEFAIEGGMGIGLKYRYPLHEVVSVYGLIAAGPHFITARTVDQANGFNFTETLGVGINVHIMPGASLDLGFRARHLSNADLRDPNCGIDTYFGTIGFMIAY
ncbi:MAG: acyloxyacyl hydrolase [Syntrophales bacterium]|nr:acyloxyacyl hydrolase [Syntrophales bacterium]